MNWELGAVGLGAVVLMLGAVIWKSGSAQRKLKKQARRSLREEQRAAKALDDARQDPLPDDDDVADWVSGRSDKP